MTAICGCRPGHTCDCCTGVAVSTPVLIANRPGLDTLSYRVGTHATFFATMKARLSGSADPALAGLTTRATDDPSIALLDAWAVVADVLTFYQERIANEGYLRTATERRSILELARLVGYTLRPGVAASTFLAYTIEKDNRLEIPAGARAQSVPAPGELPQTFETTQPLVARDVWNNLQVRLTKPQNPKPGDLATGGRLYFKGIATNLKVNDALLLRFTKRSSGVYRIKKVNVEAEADRTRVEVELWGPGADSPAVAFGNGTGGTAALQPMAFFVEAEPVQPLLASFRERLTTSKSKAAGRVGGLLDRLESAIAPAAGEPDFHAVLEGDVLPQLREEHRLAVEGNFTTLEPVLNDLIAGLENAAPGEVPTVGMTAAAFTAPPNGSDSGGSDNGGSDNGDSANVIQCGEGDFRTSPKAELPDIIGPLSRQASGPRPTLSRGVGDAFAEGSDSIPRVLTALYPELASNLYTAWADVPVTPAPAAAICVLRTQASVFGHNAPLRLRSTSGGTPIFEEWKVIDETNTQPQAFVLRTEIVPGTAPTIKTSVTLGGFQGTSLTVPLQVGRFYEISFTGTEVFVRVFVRSFQGGTSAIPVTLVFSFLFGEAGFFGSVEIAVDPQGQQLILNGIKPPVISTAEQQTTGFVINIQGALTSSGARVTEEENVVWLDAPHPEILPGGFMVLERPRPLPGESNRFLLRCIQEVELLSRAEYGMSAKSTRVVLDERWIAPLAGDDFSIIRRTAVFAQCERLELAEEPIDPIVEDVCSAKTGTRIELAGLFDGLEPGRPLIVSGERTDIKAGTSADPVRIAGVPAQELVLLAGVEQRFDEDLPGDRAHTTLILAKDLTYCYRRDTVKIFANVVPANHGETRTEVLGGGDATRPQQSFTLRQKPLTFVAAPTPSGIESTLRVRANDILRHEAESFTDAGPTDRVYVSRIDDSGTTTVTFGDGVHGARLPTGSENVRATYRVGIGKQANLGAGRISQAMDRPLGVKDVINPLPATGGAGPESRDQARRNAPLAVTALDRLVGLQDYADFARTFAGIGKAEAVRLSDGFRQVVAVTIAGIDDIPIDPTAELFANLDEALRRFGDPHQPLRLLIREPLLLVVAAQVRIDPDFLFEKVEPQIRAAMADAFGFDRRDLGQDVQLSEVISTIQRVPGVDHVDVDLLTSFSGGLDEIQKKAAVIRASGGDGPAPRLVARSARIDEENRTVFLPAQLAYFNPGARDTLILQERKP